MTRNCCHRDKVSSEKLYDEKPLDKKISGSGQIPAEKAVCPAEK